MRSQTKNKIPLDKLTIVKFQEKKNDLSNHSKAVLLVSLSFNTKKGLTIVSYNYSVPHELFANLNYR